MEAVDRRTGKSYYHYLVPKMDFIKVKRFLDGRIFWRMTGGKILVKTPYSTYDEYFAKHKITHEEAQNIK